MCVQGTGCGTHNALDHVTCRDEVLPTSAVDGERCTLRLTPPDIERTLYDVF